MKRLFRSSVLLLLSTVLLTACGGGGGGGGGDSTPPTVSSVTPAAGSMGLIPTGTVISATFNETMDRSSITTDTFVVSNGATAIPGAISYSGATATFTPSAPLPYGTTFTAKVTTGVRDVVGNPMASDYTWTFTTWAGTRQFGSAEDEISYAVAVDASGNIYMAGSTAGSLAAPNIGPSDVLVVKYDANGTLVWARQLGTEQDETATAITVDSIGNVYVAGLTYGNIDSRDPAFEPADPNGDIFVVKYDAGGTALWTRRLLRPEADSANGIAVDASGNVYVAGYTYEFFADALIAKYDAGGNLLFTKLLGTNESESANDITFDSSGNLFITGFTSGNLDGGTSNPDKTIDAFVAKYDANFDVNSLPAWVRQFGTTGTDQGFGVTTDASGNVYVTGSTDGGLDGHTNAGSFDIFLAKYDTAGAKQWTTQTGTTEADQAFDVATDGSGNIYVTGYTDGGLDGITNEGFSDPILVKFDSAGTKTWSRQLGTIDVDEASGIATDSSGSIYVSGHTYGGLDGNTNANSVADFGTTSDIFLAKYNSNGDK